jgi:hypothetical protein
MILGRGVHYLDGEMACLLAGVGRRGPRASIRVAIDDDSSQVRVDGARLVFANDRHYPRKTLLGDLLFVGRGWTADGREVPIGLHTRFDKLGAEVVARPHLHPTVADRLVDVRLEPLVVEVDGREVLTPALVRRVALHPPLADWLGRALITIRRNASLAAADLSVGVGVGPLWRPLVRAELHGSASGSLADLLQRGDWLLRWTALSRARDLREHVGRAVFLLGLDELPALRRVAADGLRKGESLVFRMEGGAGLVELDGTAVPLPDALDLARAYLEYDFLGAVLAGQLARPPAAAEAIVL